MVNATWLARSMGGALVVVLLGVAFAAPGASAQATVSVHTPDTRTPLSINASQRAHVLGEMRGLLVGTQQIILALTTNDMEAVAKAARPLGMGMVGKPEEALKKILPKPFMFMGFSVHRDFDIIADEALSKRDTTHTLKQVATTLAKCTACHDAYRLELASEVMAK